MLRNTEICAERDPFRSLLNEVLSLNAQESSALLATASTLAILNEVLSLNAQEFWAISPGWKPNAFPQ